MDSRSTPNQALTTREAARGTISQCLLDLGIIANGLDDQGRRHAREKLARQLDVLADEVRQAGSGWGGRQALIKRERLRGRRSGDRQTDLELGRGVRHQPCQRLISRRAPGQRSPGPRARPRATRPRDPGGLRRTAGAPGASSLADALAAASSGAVTRGPGQAVPWPGPRSARPRRDTDLGRRRPHGPDGEIGRPFR